MCSFSYFFKALKSLMFKDRVTGFEQQQNENSKKQAGIVKRRRTGQGVFR